MIMKQEKIEEKTKHCKNPMAVLSCILGTVIMLLLLSSVIVCYRNAKAWGTDIGENTGKLVGLAKGSYEGITERIANGREDGKEQGLSAEDTQVMDATGLEGIGRLEVLVASVKLDDYHQIKDDYKAIYVFKADAVFTVDLENAEIKRTDTTVEITLKKPSVELEFNEGETEQIAEWQKHFYSGKSEDGYNAYINSRREIQNNSTEKIENYEDLMSMAEESAKTQVEALVKAICGNEITVEITFSDEGG